MDQFNVQVPSGLWCFINRVFQVDLLRQDLVFWNHTVRTNVIFLFEDGLLLYVFVFGVLGWQNSRTFDVWPVIKAQKHVFFEFCVQSESRPNIESVSGVLLFSALILLLFWSVIIINWFFCFDSKPDITTECEAHIYRAIILRVVLMGYRLFCPITLKLRS